MSKTTESQPAEGIPAATIVIFRNALDGGAPEVLVTIRSRNLAFAGGMAVFPGGRVDPADFALAEQLDHGLSDNEEAAHRIAALRETLEETGLAIGVAEKVTAQQASDARAMLLENEDFAPVLSHFGWTLKLNEVLPYARWFPKNEKLSRIFDTRFYLYDIGTGAVDIAVDQNENSRLFWVTAQGALDMAETGDISLIFPTRRNFERLAQYNDYAAARADSEAWPVKIITPFVEDEDGVPYIRFGEDHGYPVTGETIESAARG